MKFQSRAIFCLFGIYSGLTLTSNKLLAQSSEVPSDNTETLYDDSFSTSGTPPTPPPEGEPDTSGIDTLNPDQQPSMTGGDNEFDSYTPDRFRMGLSGAITVPHVLNLAIESDIDRKYGVSLNYGNVARNINGIDVEMRHVDIRFRYFAHSTSFFYGLGFGQHVLTGKTKSNISATIADQPRVVATQLKLRAQSNYVLPHVGWFAVWEPGFTIGLDIGALLPMGPKSSFEANFSGVQPAEEETLRSSSNYTKEKKNLEDATEAVAKKTLPFVTMMRVGWMF
jgi:hypothetical protein